MSRYQRLALSPLTRDELATGLAALGLAAEWSAPDTQIDLHGSLECAGEPVDVRLPAGTLGSVEDLGFLLAPSFALVCGEFDRALLERRLLAPLTQAVATARARAAADAAGLTVDEHLEADGTRRLVLTARPPRP
jgi:hypothetical protein